MTINILNELFLTFYNDKFVSIFIWNFVNICLFDEFFLHILIRSISTEFILFLLNIFDTQESYGAKISCVVAMRMYMLCTYTYKMLDS